jgi:MFS family permease
METAADGEMSRCSTPSPSINAPLYSFDSSGIQLEGDEDPRNWSKLRKWYTTGVISLMGFISPLGSSIIVPGGPFIGHDFHVHRTLSLLTVSLFVLGLGVGPFLLAPASELKGRHPLYVGSSIVFVLLNLGSTLVTNFPGLLVLRFLAGAAGSTGPSLGAGSIVSIYKSLN